MKAFCKYLFYNVSLFQFCPCAVSQNVPVVEFLNVVEDNVKDSEERLC